MKMGTGNGYRPAVLVPEFSNGDFCERFPEKTMSEIHA